MTRWLLDASVLLAREDTDDAQHTGATRLLQGSGELATLDLAWYEVTNVAVRSWRDAEAAGRLRRYMTAIGEDGGILAADAELLESAAGLADDHSLSAYDAAYVAASRRTGMRLVSCDQRDLVSAGFAMLPEHAAKEND